MTSITKVLYLVLFSLKSIFFGAADTMFTSLSEMETLIETEESVIKSLEEYVNIERVNLDIVDRYLNRSKVEHFKAIQDVSDYLASPINALSLIKRLTVDLQALERFIKRKTVYRKNRIVKYPTEASLVDTAKALVRLQITYNLNITLLANGVINYSSSDNIGPFMEIVTPMTSSECFELGLVPAEEQGHSGRIAWMMEALNKLRTENCSICIVRELAVLDHITNGYYQMGDLKNTIGWIKKRMILRPKSEETLKQAKFMRKLQKQLIVEQQSNQSNESSKVNHTTKNPLRKLSTSELSHSACQGKINVRQEIRSRLRCGYIYGPHPFLRLARFKAELLHLVPDVVLIHRVISDTEIRILQFMARPKLWRDKPPGQQSYMHIRRSFALMDENVKYVARITRRVTQFTGFNIRSSDPLKVINYGLGGDYRPHYDFYSNDSDVQPELIAKGDKYITVMFYMSNVKLGGATVFNKLGLKVDPVKGAALIWQNLHPSGDGNYEMMHQACPVLQGSKWIAIKWAREADQNYCPIWKTLQGIMTEEMYQKFNLREPFRDKRLTCLVGGDNFKVK